MRRLILLLAVVAACGDNIKGSPDDAGIDSTVDATPPGRLTGCLDRPEQLPAAPGGQLPCDLVPPGLTL
jgi:hypothetical protein